MTRPNVPHRTLESTNANTRNAGTTLPSLLGNGQLKGNMNLYIYQINREKLGYRNS